MTKASVPMFRNMLKSITVDTEATKGAQVGVNLLAPDGSLVKWSDILNVSTTPASSLSNNTTDDLDEGQFNLYFTNRRAQDAVGGILADSANVTLAYVGGSSITADLTDVTVGTGGTLQKYGFDAKGRLDQEAPATTTDLPEGTNLYFTTQRAQDAAGALATNSADINLTYNGGSHTLTPTLVPTGVIAGTYGDASHYAVVTVDVNGRVTSASQMSITAGSGTVTSVGLSAPSIFSVSGSPVTTSGTLALSLATQSAGLVWAGPVTGSAAAPTFRALVASDIPSVSTSWGSITGTLSAQTDLQTALNALQPLIIRSSVTVTSSSGSAITGSVAMSKKGTLLNLNSNSPLRIRLYPTAALQAADFSRPSSQYQLPGSGLLFEGITTATLPSFDSAPPAVFFNGDGTVTNAIYYALEPSVAVSTTATLTYVEEQD